MKQFTLPREFGEKWLAALRSGKYRQTVGALCRGNSYCCIGLAGKIVGATSKFMRTGGAFTNDPDYSNEDSYGMPAIKAPNSLPEQIIGVASRNQLVQELICLNDNQRKSFAEIADWIESNVDFI